MDGLRELYQELILDHSKAPRNFGALAEANCDAKGHNPLCGDQLDLHVYLKDNKVEDIRFEGSGCAISVASASLMTEMIKGKTKAEAEQIFHIFHHMITEEELPDQASLDQLDKLVALMGVRDYPMRVKCATLAWHTLDAALHDKEQASTE